MEITKIGNESVKTTFESSQTLHGSREGSIKNRKEIKRKIPVKKESRVQDSRKVQERRKAHMGTGKKKIEIKKKDKAEDRMVTFSKRKKGLFRKASQLNALSGSYVGIVVFSPAGRPHTNSPMFDHALSLYLSSIGAPADDSGTFGGNTSDDVSTLLDSVSVENIFIGSAGGHRRGYDHHHADDSGTFGGGSSTDEGSTWLNSVQNSSAYEHAVVGTFGGNTSDDDVSKWLNSVKNLLLGSAEGELSSCGDDHHADGSVLDGSAMMRSNTVKPEVGGTSSTDENDLCEIQNHNNINEWLNSIEVEKIEKLEDLLLIKQKLDIIWEKIADKICSSYLV